MAATVKASKSTAKRPAQKPQRQLRPEPAAEPDGLDFEPPRLTSSSEPARRVALFYINDTEYTVTTRPGVNVGLKYLHLNRTQGEAIAFDYLLEKLLGAEGYQALMDYDDLTQEQFQQICEVAAKLTLGALEAPKA